MQDRVRGRSKTAGDSGGRHTPGLRCGRSRLARWIGALGLALGLVACSEPPTPPLTVGINTWVGYDPLVLARDRGLTDARQIKVVELVSSADTVRHLRNGLLDAAAMTLDEALKLADSGFELRIVALLDASVGADVVLAVPRITRLEQLRGERIAVTGATVSLLVAERMLQQAGLTRADVTLVPMESAQHLTALLGDSVAAAVSYAPVDGLLRQAGFRPIFDSSRMPGDIVDVLVVRPSVLRQRPQAVEALLAAWGAGLRVLQLDPPGAAAALGPGVNMSPGQYQAVLGGLRFYSSEDSLAALTGDPPALVRDGRDVAELLLSIGVLRQPPRWTALIDTAPGLRALAARQSP